MARRILMMRIIPGLLEKRKAVFCFIFIFVIGWRIMSSENSDFGRWVAISLMRFSTDMSWIFFGMI